jgi:hypothetical protein
MDKDNLIKNAKTLANHFMDRKLFANLGLEKAFGIRDLWFKNGLKTGLLVGAVMFSPKHKALFALWCIYNLVDNIAGVLDLDREEAKMNERLMNNSKSMFEAMMNNSQATTAGYDPKKNGPIN